MALKVRPGITDIKPYVGGLSKTGDKVREVIKLSSNENALGASPKAIEAYKKAAERLHRYPDGGSEALRNAIGEVYGFAPSRIVCGAGSDELIALLCAAYAGVGDEILYPEYGFLMYPISAKRVGATPVTAKEKNLRTDVDALLAAVTERTKIVFFANPNNPTGSYISKDEVRRLRAGLPEHVLLVIDAAYAEYVEESAYDSGAALVDAGDNTVMLRTFSKIYGLASLRLGWVYCPEPIADILNRVRGPFNVSGAAQEAGVAAIRDTEFTERSRAHNTRQLAYLTQSIRALGITVYPAVANFLLLEFPKEAGKDAEGANKFLMEQGIIPRAVASYGLGHCLRITVGTEKENQAVVKALEGFKKA
ncbi:MAG: hisC [Rickettsiales bacterium]|jgi:histidinol-phosphate aminotransferase|nr:hisC [Rickettsiales bacterium]